MEDYCKCINKKCCKNVTINFITRGVKRREGCGVEAKSGSGVVEEGEEDWKRGSERDQFVWTIK